MKGRVTELEGKEEHTEILPFAGSLLDDQSWTRTKPAIQSWVLGPNPLGYPPFISQAQATPTCH